MRTRRFGFIRVHYKKSRIRTLGRAGCVYAHVGGGAVVKDLPGTWKHINGFFFNTDVFGVMVTFRRHVL